MNVMEMLQKQFQDSASSLQTVQREYSKMLSDRQTLDSQLNENRQVRIDLHLRSFRGQFLKKYLHHVTWRSMNGMWDVELCPNKVRAVFDISHKTQTGRVLCIRQHESGEQLTQIIQSYWIPSILWNTSHHKYFHQD